MALLEGRVGLVTSAGRMRGIGRATALRLAREGAAVVVSAAPRDPAAFPPEEQAAGWRGAALVADEIIAAGGRALAFACDVTAPAQVAAMFEEPPVAPQRPGHRPRRRALAPDSRYQPQRHLTCVEGCRAGHARRGRRRRDRDLSSLAGRSGIANYGAYCASKFGVIGFTQQLALELVRLGIRVNCVCPGSVETDMMDGTFQRTAGRNGKVDFSEVKQAVARGIPMRRQGTPEEQATTVAFLLSDEAGYITGQTTNVDGGARMD